MKKEGKNNSEKEEARNLAKLSLFPNLFGADVGQISSSSENFIRVDFERPIKPNLAFVLFLGYRKGNKVLMVGNKMAGMIIHEKDWFDLQRLAKKDILTKRG